MNKMIQNDFTNDDIYIAKFCLTTNETLSISGERQVCAGTNNLLFEVNPLEQASTYLWVFPVGVTSEEGFVTQDSKIIVNFPNDAQSGNLFVTPINDCGLGTPSAPFEIIVERSVDDIVIEQNCSTLSLSGSNIAEIRWFKDGQPFGNINSLNIQIVEIGEYTVESSNFCGITFKSIQVNTIFSQNNSIPNAFTPNNDGKNDFFVIAETISPIKLKIFDRLGLRVYESFDYNNDWDGADLPTGIYFYYIEIDCSENPLKGWVHLIR